MAQSHEAHPSAPVKRTDDVTRPRTRSLQEKYHPVDAAGKPLHAKILDARVANPHHTHLDLHHPSPVRTPSPSRISRPSSSSKLGKTEKARIDKYEDGKRHVLVGATGSVASVKIPLIVKSLMAHEEVEVQVIVTKTAKHFVNVDKLKAETGVKVWEDEDDWKTWHELSDPILHIELRRWAHLLLIAPTSANTLAKIANGLCDNLLSNVLRAWNPQIPILLAPAMNTQMYTHPITAHHLSLIKTHLPYIELVNPIEKILACGDVGMGGMAEWGDIVGRVVKKLHLRIRPESDEEEIANGADEDETNVDEDEDDEGVEEDEGIRAGGEEHEDEKRDNEVREREEEEEERQEVSRQATRV